MYETAEERELALKTIRSEILQQFKLKNSEHYTVFYHPNSFRLKKPAFIILRKSKEFIKVQLDVNTFSVKDLLKISKLNNNLFYIDTKKSVIYTMDADFANWCLVCGGDKNALYTV